MKNQKIYQSRAWMTRQYRTLKFTPEQIAEKADVSTQTIYTWLEKFGLLR